jgi:hypothetical protein
LIPQNFILYAKTALEIQKTRVALDTRIYSQLVEHEVRSHPSYNLLSKMRASKTVDRKKTAAFTKKLLKEQLAADGISEEAFKELFEKSKLAYEPYPLLVKAEHDTFKILEPMLEQIPVYAWIKAVRGLGVRYAVKLISNIRSIERFENPSKLRKYCGTVPGQKKMRNVEAQFNPELKGILLGQIAENFIKNNSQYKRVYDEKKAYYLGLHPEALETRPKGKKLTKEDWTKAKIHNFAKKTMINRFLVDLWMAWWKSGGKEPPKNPYIASLPGHSLDPMIVPYPPPEPEEKKPKKKAKK